MEIVIGLFIVVGAYFVGAGQKEEIPVLNPDSCVRLCDSVKSYDEYRKRCECK